MVPITTSKVYKVFSILGIITPLVLFIFITFLSIFFPGYDILTGYVSVLGSHISPFRAVVNVFGFGLFGVIMMGFALALEQQLQKNHLVTTAVRLFLAGGALIMILAFFPIDTNPAQATFDGRMHSIFGAMAFIILPISIIWFGLAFRKDDDWDNLWRVISFVLAIIALVVAAILGFFPKFIFNGSIERVGMGAVLLWMSLVSINIFLNNQFNRTFNRK